MIKFYPSINWIRKPDVKERTLISNDPPSASDDGFKDRHEQVVKKKYKIVSVVSFPLYLCVLSSHL